MKRWFIFFNLIFLPPVALTSTFNLTSYIPFASLSLGSAFVGSQESHSVTLLPPFENYYYDTSRDSSVLEGGFLLGLEKQLMPVNYQIGIGINTNAVIKRQGLVWQFGLPEFNNLRYEYRIKPNRISIQGKVLKPLTGKIAPYFSAELGIAFNKASQYTEQALIPEAVPTIHFRDHTATSFTYGLGLGADYSMTPTLHTGLGYKFIDLGSARLSSSQVQLSSDVLRINHLYANEVLFYVSKLL